MTTTPGIRRLLRLLVILPAVLIVPACSKKDDDDPLPPAPTTAISMVSVAADGVTVANGTCSEPAMSADGNIIAFASTAANLDGATGGRSDIYVKNMSTGAITRIRGNLSADPDNDSQSPSISDDGRYVAFVSKATNMIAGGTITASRQNIYLHDRTLVTTVLVSHINGVTTTNGGADSVLPTISSSGDYVVYQSAALDLLAAPTAANQVFRYGRVATTNAQVSLDAAGTASANGLSFGADVSSDGRYVIYQSTATTIHANDADAEDDIYVRDMTTIAAGHTLLVSRANGLAGAKGNDPSTSPRISNDASTVVFMSTATNFEESDGGTPHDIFVRNWQAGSPVTTKVSRHSSSGGTGGACDRPEIGLTGQFVLWHSLSSTLVDNDTNGFLDFFRHDFSTHNTLRVSVSAGGGEQNNNSSAVRGSLTPDGLYAAFGSLATNLVGSPAANGLVQIYRKGSY